MLYIIYDMNRCGSEKQGKEVAMQILYISWINDREGILFDFLVILSAHLF